MQIIDGKKLRNEILENIKAEVAKLPFQPIFCDVLVGDDPASAQYMRMKYKTAESVGMGVYNAVFAKDISTDNLIKEIEKINLIENMCGIIVQLPLLEHLDKRKILDSIDPMKDVDCLGAKASEKFYAGDESLGYPTALSCMALLDSTGHDLKGKKIVVLGHGELVGRPTEALLKFRNLNPVVVTRNTENKEEIIKNADIIISGIGNGKFITGDKIKNGVMLIDAGTSESLERSSTGELNAGIVGDVDLESVKDVASFVSPVPGGVGPVTVAMLLNNVLKVAKKYVK